MPTPTRQTRYDTGRAVITCPECGSDRHVSQRHHNAIRNGEHAATCPTCRRQTANVRVTHAHRRYWLTRYTLDEIREMAAGLELLLGDSSRGAKPRRRNAA